MRAFSSISVRLTHAAFIVLVVAGLFAVSPTMAACGNAVVEAGEDCDDGGFNGSFNSCCNTSCFFTGKAPDVIVGDLTDVTRYGNVGGITAFAVGTTSCNLGSCWLKWISNTPEHPVIGQNMYRLKNGRFEQIGQSWLKHGFTALQQTECSNDCNASGTGARLGVSCSDPYESSLNGTQTNLGPKDAVNPNTGVFQYPDSRINLSGNVIYKRLQIHDADIDPTPTSTLYFVEGQYVTQDDAAAKRNNNNASYRPASFTVGGLPPSYQLSLSGSTVRQKAGIQAWNAIDPSVSETFWDVFEGRFILSAKATALGGGVYHYEYAIQNLNNNRGAQSFSVPLPPGTTVTNVGFHDVDYHSGEPYSGADWTPTVSATSVTWATQTYAENQLANALRWGTLYNFRFDADVAPGVSLVTMGLFKPGNGPTSTTKTTVTPGPCAGAPNGTPCDDANECTADDACSSGVCTGAGPVLPGDVGNGVRMDQADGVTTITWDTAPNSTSSAILRGLMTHLPVGPGGDDEVCVSGIAGNSYSDPDLPPENDSFWYLIQGRSTCGGGSYGSEFTNGLESERISTTCP